MVSNLFLELDKETANESLEWLQLNAPGLARGVETAVRGGATPEEIFWRLIDRLGAHRRALALRCKLAAEGMKE